MPSLRIDYKDSWPIEIYITRYLQNRARKQKAKRIRLGSTSSATQHDAPAPSAIGYYISKPADVENLANPDNDINALRRAMGLDRAHFQVVTVS